MKCLSEYARLVAVACALGLFVLAGGCGGNGNGDETDPNGNADAGTGNAEQAAEEQRNDAGEQAHNGQRVEEPGTGWHELPREEAERQLELVNAIIHDDVSYAEWLLEQGVSVNAMDDRGVTALHAAARGGHADLVRLLAERGADLETRVTPNATPLHWAVRGGDVETVETLLDLGANIHAEADYGYPTPLALARNAGNEEIIALLLRRGAQR